jgi:hypothetical protein
MTFQRWIAALAAAAAVFSASGCAVHGKVEQGRAIAYDKNAGTVTIVPESLTATADPGTLPPLTVKIPADPDEMGPAPVPGRLMRLDTKARRAVILDSTSGSFRTLDYAPVAELRRVTKAPKSLVDRAKKTITLYSKDQQVAITFAASDELLALPDDTWRSGDVIRYYYQDPHQALRMMNVTRTDLSKSGG